MKFYKKIIKNITKASILTGALLFTESVISAKDSLVVADTIHPADTSLLVKKDSTQVQAVGLDTNFTETDTAKLGAMIASIKKKKFRSPVKAGLYSAIIPGLGQAYNHKYWKIPLIYIGGGLLVNACIYYNDYYKKYMDLYNEEYFKPPGLKREDYASLYGNNRDKAARIRNRYVLFTGLLYAANIVDAIVDAYFSEFDISDNLSMKVKPAITYPEYAMAGNLSLGMSVRINF